MCILASGSKAAVLGDVTGDGNVRVDDAVKLLRISVGLDAPTDAQMILGDVAPHPGMNGRRSGDRVINVQDVIYLLRYAVGLISPADFGAVEQYVALTPLYVALAPGDQVQFTAVPVNMSGDVTWSLIGGAGGGGQLGTLTQNGLYSAADQVSTVVSATVEAQVGAQQAQAEVDVIDSGPPPPPPPPPGG
jgi:hypothetical protein